MLTVNSRQSGKAMYCRQSKWDVRYLRLAELVSTWSKDPSTKVGAVIVDPILNAVVSTGYNGFPVIIDDTDERLQDRDLKYNLIVHAEMNAILRAHCPIFGFTLYCTLAPCIRCATSIIQSGIKRVVAPKCTNERWAESTEQAIRLLHEARITTFSPLD